MGTRFQPYPTYQASDIAWYKAAPVHWQAVRFKHALSQKQKTPNNQLGAGSISFGKVIFKDSESIPSETLASYQEVLAGEFLINPLNMNYDLISLRTALSTINVVVSTGYIVLQCAGLLDKEFTKWLLHEFDVAHMKTLGSGVRQTITYADIGNSYFLKPPLSEQAQIATFLDRQTAKIDRLIEKQQRLIELLEEKRQAVISHAVTKGLNPDAPMKDSGVEWLGQVPEHWDVKRFKFLCGNLIAGPFGSSITKDMYVKSGYKVYGQEQVIPDDFTIGDYYITEHAYRVLERYTIKPGDVLISCVGTFGKIAIVPEEAEPGIINPRLIMAKLKHGVASSYIGEFLKSDNAYKQFENLSRGGTMGVINIAILKEIMIPVPPETEQDAMNTFIAKQKLKFAKLIQSSWKSIDLLKERRTALISAAVTGKIDVRDQVSQDVEEAFAS